MNQQYYISNISLLIHEELCRKPSINTVEKSFAQIQYINEIFVTTVII